MKIFLKRAALIFSLWAMVSVFAFNNFAEAKADISYTTTSVTMEKGKCTVNGYFTNSGFSGGTPTQMKISVKITRISDNAVIWANSWISNTTVGSIPSLSSKSWYFSLTDNSCPKLDSNSFAWTVNSNVSWNND